MAQRNTTCLHTAALGHPSSSLGKIAVAPCSPFCTVAIPPVLLLHERDNQQRPLQYSAVINPATQLPQVLWFGACGDVYQYTLEPLQDGTQQHGQLQGDEMQCGTQQPEAHDQEFVAIQHIRLTGQRPDLAVHLLRRLPEQLLTQHKVHHPHIAHMRDAFLSSDQGNTCLNIVMDYVARGSLLDYVSAKPPGDENTARWFFQQLIATLDYLQTLDVPLRNTAITLDNICTHPVPSLPHPLMKLVDFGPGLPEPLPTDATSCGGNILYVICNASANGHYKAPEQLKTQPTDPTTSPGPTPWGPPAPEHIWSAGVLLYALLKSAYPVPKDSPLAQRLESMHARHLPNTTGLTPSCTDLLEHMLHPDPGQRITIEVIKQHPWFLEGLNPALLDLKDSYIGLPSPCQLTAAESEAVVSKVQQVLQEELCQALTG